MGVSHVNARGTWSVVFLACALFVTLSQAGHAQCGSPFSGTINPTPGQITCISAIGAGPDFISPAMPPIGLFETDDNTCDTFQYTLTVSFSQSGVSDPVWPQGTFGFYQSAAGLEANVPWIVDWTLNLDPENGLTGFYEGGVAQETYNINGAGNQLGTGFWIAGVNPSLGPSGVVAQQMQLDSAPWWFGHALSTESYGGMQFYYGTTSASTQSGGTPGSLGAGYFGAPVFGPPDGFGIAQVDGSSGANTLYDEDFWDWSQNLFDGIEIAYEALSPAQTYLGGQVTDMSIYTSARGLAPIYPAPENYSSICSFTYPGSGNSAYYNLEWITDYNGGHWTQWQVSSLSWPIVAPLHCDPHTGVCALYAYTVCTNPTQTI